MAAISLFGKTSSESELKLLELRFISSRHLKKLKSLGSVQKSFDAISSTLNFCMY